MALYRSTLFNNFTFIYTDLPAFRYVLYVNVHLLNDIYMIAEVVPNAKAVTF